MSVTTNHHPSCCPTLDNWASIPVIHWRTDDRRSGTILPSRGEDWPAMLAFLGMTGAGHVFAHGIGPHGNDTILHDGPAPDSESA